MYTEAADEVKDKEPDGKFSVPCTESCVSSLKLPLADFMLWFESMGRRKIAFCAYLSVPDSVEHLKP